MNLRSQEVVGPGIHMMLACTPLKAMHSMNLDKLNAASLNSANANLSQAKWKCLVFVGNSRPREIWVEADLDCDLYFEKV